MYGIDVTDVADAAAVRVGTASEPAAALSVDVVAATADAVAVAASIAGVDTLVAAADDVTVVTGVQQMKMILSD